MTRTNHVRGLVFLLMISLAACKHGGREVVTKASALIDEVYACRDQVCVKAVEQKLFELNNAAFEAHDLDDDEAAFLASANDRILRQDETLYPPGK